MPAQDINSSYALLIFKERIGNFNVVGRWRKIQKLVVRVDNRRMSADIKEQLKRGCLKRGKKKFLISFS